MYLVFNTIGNLPAQDDQVRCCQNAARHLDDDGVFDLERRVPAAPPELDLTAGIAGLRPRDRWGGWEAEPFTATRQRPRTRAGLTRTPPQAEGTRRT